MQPRAIVDIDLKALRHNFAQVKKYAPHSKILAMVKGNAYGHGMIPIAHALPEADFLGVARLEEALQLREAHVTRPIVLMNGVYDDAGLAQACKHKCHLVVHSLEQALLLWESQWKPEFVWLKIDTGMHRYGLSVTEAPKAYQRLRQKMTSDQLGWMTHFACSDNPAHALMSSQLSAFNAFTCEYSEIKSMANSAAIVQFPQTHAEVVRPGLMLYGVSPCSNQTAQAIGLQPVMTFHSEVVALHDLPVGATVGYSATWTAQRPSKIAVIPVGYADGYPQMMPSGTPVLINGRIVKTVGRVSMDTLTVDITDHPGVQRGDVVTLWGNGLPIESVAQSARLSVYAMLTGVTKRAEYRFI